MKRLLILYFALFTFASAQTLKFSGYYEAEADETTLPHASYSYAYHKLRLDMEANPADHIQFRADVISKTYFGDRSFDLNNFIHPDYFPAYYLASSPITFTLPDTLLLDNLEVSWSGKRTQVCLGRQQISPGVGYAWNPLDIFNHKDVMDPTYEQTGIPALTVQVLLPAMVYASWVAVPGNSFHDTEYMMTLKRELLSSDLALSWIVADSPRIYGPLIWPARRVLGLSTETDAAGLGLRTEIAVSRVKTPGADTETKTEAILGADYTFESSLYVLLEAFHSDFGVTAEKTNIFDFLAAYEGVRRSLNRNYLFLYGAIPAGDLLTISASMIANLDDQSLIVMPQVDYSLNQAVNLEGTAILPQGKAKSEFAWQSYGGRVRINVYF